MPGVIGRGIVLPRLREFEQRFPDIELVLGMSDRPADLIFDGIDCVTRSGALGDSSLIARPLGKPHWLTCASPRYLDAYLQCGLEGLGLIHLSEFVVRPYLDTGRLKEVLATTRSTPIPVSIVYPGIRNANAAVRAFVDWIIEIFPPSGFDNNSGIGIDIGKR
jgi:LysR family transcriptional regulator for bpeEF and oprC